MAPFTLSNDRDSPRCFPWLWFVRILQMVVTVLILAITAWNASDFSGIGCSVPSKLAYNIAAAVLSFIVLVVLLLSTGPRPALRVIPWVIWGQLALDAFMFVIWIAAAGVSTYHCGDLCSACSGYDEVWASGLDCLCNSYYVYYKRDQSPAPKGLARSIQERAYHGSHRGGGRVAGKIALDSIMVVLFAFTTAMTIFWIFKNRRSGAAATAPTTTSQPTVPQQPAAGAVQSTQVFPEKMDQPYTNQPLQQGNYPPQSQPQMQQGGYPEPAPNMQPSTYPSSGPQGSTSEYYTQPPPQSQPQQAQYPSNHAEMGAGSHPTEYKSVSPVSG